MSRVSLFFVIFIFIFGFSGCSNSSSVGTNNQNESVTDIVQEEKKMILILYN